MKETMVHKKKAEENIRIIQTEKGGNKPSLNPIINAIELVREIRDRS